MTSQRYVRVALLQLEPIFRHPEKSVLRAEELLESLELDEVDLLMLPEMAFSGYCFRSREDIEPFLEADDGPTVQWAQRTALQKRCHVIVGFPERSRTLDPAGRPLAYNSIAIVSDTGHLVRTYRKHHLFPPVDDLWATPGPEWCTVDLQVGTDIQGNRTSVRCALGICMDLNPHRFEAPFDAFELATFATDSQADVILVSMAWLVAEAPELTAVETEEDDPEERSWEETKQTLGYWALRCKPFLDRPGGGVFVGCNRVGTEPGVENDQDTVFTGLSSVLSNVERDQVTVLALAPKEGEHLLRARFALPNRG